MFPKNFNEPTGAPAIFEKQVEIKLLHSASTLESRIQVMSSHYRNQPLNLSLLRYVIELKEPKGDMIAKSVTFCY
ncbi:MAG: hypothetical protein P8X79_20795 [Reinekea sp.]